MTYPKSIKSVPDFFDYAGAGLIGKFLSPVYFSNMKTMVQGFYENPDQIAYVPEESWHNYYCRVREFLSRFPQTKIIRSFLLLSDTGYMIATPTSVICRPAEITEYEINTYLSSEGSFYVTDSEDISATTQSLKEKYLALI